MGIHRLQKGRLRMVQDHGYFSGTLYAVEIFIAIDNTAAAAVLRRMYSTTEAGSELVLRALAALGGRQRTKSMRTLRHWLMYPPRR